MELWIRSQSKLGLYKVDEVYIDKRDFGNNDIQHYIMTNGVTLGIYTTKERALEVLNSIQNILYLKDMYKYDRELVLKGWENVDEEQVKIVRQQMSVYEMPNE